MAENFPPIQNILDEIYIKDFHKEIDELDEDTQYKLNIEENVEINTFRKAILKFYEDYCDLFCLLALFLDLFTVFFQSHLFDLGS